MLSHKRTEAVIYHAYSAFLTIGIVLYDQSMQLLMLEMEEKANVTSTYLAVSNIIHQTLVKMFTSRGGSNDGVDSMKKSIKHLYLYFRNPVLSCKRVMTCLSHHMGIPYSRYFKICWNGTYKFTQPPKAGREQPACLIPFRTGYHFITHHSSRGIKKFYKSHSRDYMELVKPDGCIARRNLSAKVTSLHGGKQELGETGSCAILSCARAQQAGFWSDNHACVLLMTLLCVLYAKVTLEHSASDPRSEYM